VLFPPAPPPAGPGDSPRPTSTVVIGCGNPLRGDDGVGPECVRRLSARGLPAGMVAIDAGTAGFDVVLRMREAAEVIVVDACVSGRPPGTLVTLGPDDLDRLPPPPTLDPHHFRWHDAWALSRALSPAGGPIVSARLVEALQFEHGAPLSPAVDRGVDDVVESLLAAFGSACGSRSTAGAVGA